MKFSLILSFCIYIICLEANSAVSSKDKNALRNASILRGSGAIHGGMAGRGFSLLEVRTQASKNKKLERLTVGIGDLHFSAHQGAPGYFHLENSVEDKRVVVNFSQTPNVKFDQKAFQKIFNRSPFVRSSEIAFDPQTQTTSFILNLKRPASVRVVPVSGKGKKTAQLKIDLFEDSQLARTRRK